MTTPIKLICAMARNRVIGAGAGMPWNVPEEYAHYRRTIAGQTVVMGRRSYEIFGSDLTSRYAIVASRTARRLEGAIVSSSLDDAIERAQVLGREIFINGGASLYRQALPRVDEMYLSTIKGDFAGDAYFPEFDVDEWDVAEESDHDEYIFRRYRRKQRPSAKKGASAANAKAPDRAEAESSAAG